jgi:hypothetical protein
MTPKKAKTPKNSTDTEMEVCCGLSIDSHEAGFVFVARVPPQPVHLDRFVLRRNKAVRRSTTPGAGPGGRDQEEHREEGKQEEGVG